MWIGHLLLLHSCLIIWLLAGPAEGAKLSSSDHLVTIEINPNVASAEDLPLAFDDPDSGEDIAKKQPFNGLNFLSTAWSQARIGLRRILFM